MKVGKLPQSYRPKEVEEWVFRYWSENDVYRKTVSKRRGRPKFYFLDGPPYVTNPIHVGTAWNKLIKDAILRFKRMEGYDVWDKPGYDMHGLPIEVQVEKNLGFKTKKDILSFGVENFVRRCKDWALRNLKVQEKQFRDLGVWMDWEHPYRTIDNEYIEAAWLFLKKADEKGLLKYGEKVVHWCPRCGTVLSGYEVEEGYRDVEDPSIYVKFPLRSGEGSLLIWTTTPWTLPANVAVMVHPKETYVKARVDGGDVVIIAKKRLGEVAAETGLSFEVLEEFPGEALEGVAYINPLERYVPLQRELNAHIVVLSEEYVTMEEGTGLVHVAPGHGEEDYEVGQIYGLPAPSPVGEDGRFTGEAGKYSGMDVFEANEVIIEDLRSLGALLHSGKVVHRYPHCWRCKSRLILRTSKQWFVEVSRLRDGLIEEAKKTRWVPGWALDRRFIPWLSGARDWAISRQRYWGIPLPIWVCEEGHVTVVGSLEELKRMAIEMPEGEVDLHKPWIDGVVIRCPKCGKPAKRIPDVLDVWVDSGVASWASLGYPKRADLFERLWPADLILEGPDQIRGWFYSLITTSYVVFGRAPYRTVLMHGWSLDKDGRPMHKSLGNVIYPEEVVPAYGRDALRLFELSNTLWENLKFSIDTLTGYFRAINVIWNTFYFASLYMSLDNYDPVKHGLESVKDHLRSEDLWLLSRLQSVVSAVTSHMRGLRLHEAARTLIKFLVDDVSRWYVKLIRRRVWVEAEDPDKLAAYAALFNALDASLRMINPFTPFIAEYIYTHMFKGVFGEESVNMLEWPKPDERWVNPRLERLMEHARSMVEASYAARQSRGVKLRRPVRRVIVATDDREVGEAVRLYSEMLADMMNTKSIEVLGLKEARDLTISYEVRLDYSKAGPRFRSMVRRLAERLGSMDGGEVVRQLSEKGFVEVEVGGDRVRLDRDMLVVKEVVSGGYVGAPFDSGWIFIDLSVDKELEAEALARELIRRIQFLRKELALDVEELIEVGLGLPSRDALELVERMRSYISGEVRASALKTAVGGKPPIDGYTKAWEIDGESYVISIRRVKGP